MSLSPSRTVRRLLAALGCAALTVAVAPVAAAVTPFQGPVPLYGAGCTQGSGDASGSVNGTSRGAIDCGGEEDGRISAFWVQGDVRTVRTSPWTGRVLATSWDTVSQLYVLFRQGTSLKLGKVSDAGAFSATTTLSNSLDAFTPADVVAQSGRWWAVWAESQANGTQYDLYQARTLLGSQARTRITSSSAEDLEPSIGYTLGAVTMVWSRYTPGLSASDVWVARNTGAGWRSSVLTQIGTYNNLPQVASYNGHSYLSWARDGVIQYRTDAAGGWQGRSFLARGHSNRIAVSNGRVVIAWETEEPVRLYVVEGTGTRAFTGSLLTGENVGLIATTSGNGRATVVYRSGSGVSARYQV